MLVRAFHLFMIYFSADEKAEFIQIEIGVQRGNTNKDSALVTIKMDEMLQYIQDG